jgi:hypothetical protein
MHDPRNIWMAARPSRCALRRQGHVPPHPFSILTIMIFTAEKKVNRQGLLTCGCAFLARSYPLWIAAWARIRSWSVTIPLTVAVARSITTNT